MTQGFGDGGTNTADSKAPETEPATAKSTRAAATHSGEVAQLLSSLAVKGRRFVFVDLVAARHHLGLSPSATDAQISSALARGGAPLHQWFGSDQPGPTLLGDGSSLNQFSAAVVDQSVNPVPDPGEDGQILGWTGSFDGPRVLTAIARLEPGASTTSYHGVSIVNWNDLSPDAIKDPMRGDGVFGALGVVRGAIFRTQDLPTMHRVADGPGAGESLPTSPSGAVLDALLDAGAYAGAFVSVPWGLQQSLLFASSAQVEQLAHHSLGTYATLGLGVTATATGYEMIVVLGHNNRASATANVSRLRDVFENGLVFSLADANRPALVPAASLFAIDSVEQRDDVVIGRFRVHAANVWFAEYANRLNLLADP